MSGIPITTSGTDGVACYSITVSPEMAGPISTDGQCGMEAGHGKVEFPRDVCVFCVRDWEKRVLGWALSLENHTSMF